MKNWRQKLTRNLTNLRVFSIDVFSFMSQACLSVDFLELQMTAIKNWEVHSLNSKNFLTKFDFYLRLLINASSFMKCPSSVTLIFCTRTGIKLPKKTLWKRIQPEIGNLITCRTFHAFTESLIITVLHGHRQLSVFKTQISINQFLLLSFNIWRGNVAEN